MSTSKIFAILQQWWVGMIIFFSPSEKKMIACGWTNDNRRQAYILIPVIIGSLLATSLISIQYLFEFGLLSISTLGSTFGIGMCLFVLLGIKWTGRAKLFGAIYIIFSMLIILISSFSEGPFVTGIIYWITPGIFFSSYILAPEFAFVVMGIALSYIGIITYLLTVGYQFQVMPHLTFELYLVEVFRSSAIFCLSAVIAYYYESVRIRNEMFIQRRTDELANLNKQLKRITEAVESCSEAIALDEVSGGHFYQNPAFEKMFGYSFSEIFEGSYDLIHKSKSINHQVEELVAEGRIWNNEVSLVSKSGRQLSAILNAGPVFDRDGQIIGTMRIYLDITERKEIEREKEQIQVRLTESGKLAALGQMAGGIAHEINNPMAIISGTTRRIRRLINRPDFDHQQAVSFLHDIDSVSERVAKIVNGLRSFSRDGGNDPVEKIPLTQLLNDVSDLCSERFKNSGIELSFNLSDLPVDQLISCRVVQMGQVLINLLNNSFDAIEALADPKDKWVKIEASIKDHWLYLKILDGGHGIPHYLIDKIMDPFFTTKPLGKGTGLGLSISKGIIESHGGSLTIDSKQPNTSFVIKLPQKFT